MKKILLCILVSASLVACKNEETKKANDKVKDQDTGTWTSLDSKTTKVRQMLEAYVKNDSSVIYEIMADTVKVIEQFANNQEDGKMKVDPGGRTAFAQGENMHHQLFTDITLTNDNLRTFVWDKDSATITGYWGMWSGTGRFTKNKITVPVHIGYCWEGDKITRIYRMFDPGPLRAEIAASQKK